MKIDRIDTIPFSLPLKTVWRSARGSMQQRRGWVIRIQTDDGLRGFGECSPLPEAGSETHHQAECNLPQVRSTLKGAVVGDGLVPLQRWKESPSLQFGIETALLDLLARERQLPLHRLLNPSSDGRVAVNGFLGVLESAQTPQFAALFRDGYRIVKLKVGLGSVENELKTLGSISQQIPAGMMMRLDANGAWSADHAVRFIEGLSELPVESLEEPLQQFDPDLWSHLQQQCPFPLALDESLGSLDENAVLQSGIKRLVLKPMVQGGISACLALSRKAADQGIETLVTSTVDGAIGVHAAAHLAAALDNPGQTMAHGLGTSSWLQRDIATPPHVESATILLASQPGLGLVPNFND